MKARPEIHVNKKRWFIQMFIYKFYTFFTTLLTYTDMT